jgi:hypothetical protein
MAEKAVAWLVLVALMSSVTAAYFLAWRGSRSSVRRGASWVIAVLSGLASLVGIVGYAVPALDDFHDPAVSFRTAVIGNLLLWAICIGALVIAVRFTRFALRRP